MSTPKIIQDIRDLKSSQSAQDTKISNLTNQLASLGGSTLVTKYHTVNVELTNVSSPNPVTSNVNPLPTAWSAVPDTDNKVYASGDYRVSSSVVPRSATSAINQAFNTSYISTFTPIAGTSEFDMIIELPKPLKVKSISYTINKVGATLSIYGSNDNVTWSSLLGSTSTIFDDSDITPVPVNTKGELYKYYKVNIKDIDPDYYCSVHRLLISSYEIPAYSARFYSDEISEMSADERVLIKTPTTDDEGLIYNATGLSSATFQGKNLEALLLPGRYYELVYDGSIYLVKEV